MSLASFHPQNPASKPQARLRAAIGQLIERHGRWRVIRALLLSPDLRRIERLRAADLSAHMRRDVGLTPEPKRQAHPFLR